MQFIIKYHAVNRTYQCPHFFLLAKGHNTGKPLTAPRANSFVIVFNNEDDRTHLFWVCNALWQTGRFRQHLVGSVIEFIHVRDLRHLIREYCNKGIHNDQVNQLITRLDQIANIEKSLVNQLQLLGKLKNEYLDYFLK